MTWGSSAENTAGGRQQNGPSDTAVERSARHAGASTPGQRSLVYLRHAAPPLLRHRRYRLLSAPPADSGLRRARFSQMRRAALQTCRAVRRPGLRRGVRTPGFVSSRAYNNHRQRSGHQILQSSMQFRGLGYALVSTAVATGAWLAYRGDGDPLHGGSPVASVSVPGQQTRGLSASSVYTNAASTHGPTSDKAPDGGNKVLVIHEGQVFTGTLPADAPLSKETDDYGRKVVEMLTPEQATQKLRRNEESWLVGRGKGVVRYDVVQIPSNDPIEDDHAEKIIEVPQSVASTDDGSSNSDWMFWGVFDGHRYDKAVE